MMKILTALIFSGFSCFIAAGCYYDTQSELYGVQQPVLCDTTHITYSQSIVPIVNANCNSCHSTNAAPNNGKGIVLDTYASFQDQAVNGNLLHNINQETGYKPMPNNGSKLSACQIAYIQHWVDIGTPNN